MHRCLNVIMEILDAYGTITFNFDNIFSKDISFILLTFEACRLQSLPGTVSKYLKPVFMRERKKSNDKRGHTCRWRKPSGSFSMQQVNVVYRTKFEASGYASQKHQTWYDIQHCEQVLEIYRKTEDWPASFR